MNQDLFKNWFEKIIKFLPGNMLWIMFILISDMLIMDNTPYHSINLECFLNNSW